MPILIFEGWVESPWRLTGFDKRWVLCKKDRVHPVAALNIKIKRANIQD